MSPQKCRHQFGHQSRQRGVALITVLLIFAVASVIAIQMTSRLQLDIRRTENLIALDKGAVYSRGAEAYALAIIPELLKQNPQGKTLQKQDLPPYIVEEGVLKISINELSGRFNINWLADIEEEEQKNVAAGKFQRLLEALEVDAETARNISFATIDWLDADNEPTGLAGVESQTYLSADKPYRSANQPMSDISELQLIEGISSELYKKIKPYVAVLPKESKLNLNAAPLPVILSLSDKITNDEAESIISEREQIALDAVPDFVDAESIKNDDVIFSPEYFALITQADIQARKSTLVSVVYIPSKGEEKSHVLSRDQSMVR